MKALWAQKWLWKSMSTVSSRPLHVCIVGSGPDGFYTAEKVVVNQFSRVASHEQCSFFGNVCLGSSISLSELRDLYHVVVLSYGAESDKVLGIPGEDLAGIYPAREFVWWYNGHPNYSNLAPNLESGDTAVILGQGNVALDVARILLRPTVDLATTDIANHALLSLQESSIRKVYLVGRRGPMQAACTAKELREILGLKDLVIRIEEADLLKSPADEEELKTSRTQRRIFELLSKTAASQRLDPISGQRELHFVFFRRPDSFLQSNHSNRVTGVRFEKTDLKGDAGKRYAVGTGQFDIVECGLVFKSIGYKSVPVDGLPFDDIKGVVPNVRGRVLSDTSEGASCEKGLYVAGWLKRGPTGIIGTNLYCAEEVVASISEDLQHGAASDQRKRGREGLLEALNRKNIRYVPFSGWEKIDLKEKYMGSLRNKSREKMTSWEELLNIASGEKNCY